MIAQQDPIGWTSALILMFTVSLVMMGSGWLVIWVARKTADGTLGSNGWAGIRTKTTRSSDAAWTAAHQVAERPTVMAGWASIGSGVAAFVLAIVFSDGDPELATLIWSVAIMAGGTLLLMFVVVGAWKGQKAAKAVLEG